MSKLELSRRTLLTACGAGLGLRAASFPLRERIQEFDYANVRLTGGPLKDQFDRIYASYLALDNDRLLKVYRQRAGLSAPGEDMGGWYDADGFVPGHALGQYISGLARCARATGDVAAYRKTKALVDGFAATLGPAGYPFASKKAEITWPCYILDKYEIGLIDAYQLAGITPARDLLRQVIRGALPYIPDHTYDRGPNSPKQAPYDEPYILSENLFNSYAVTSDSAFLEMARKYLLDTEYFEPLAAGKNILPGKHAYSHVIALSSAAKAFLVLGDTKYFDAIRNAYEMLQSTQQYASGGWGPKEAFVEPHEGKLAESIDSTHNHFETPCGCYAQFKLSRYLLRLTADARYGDGLERVLYNTLLGVRDPDENGDYFYYSDYHPGATKGYYHSKWPCCSGTLIQGVADYLLNIYFRTQDGIYVNLFTPSQVKWSTKNASVKLIQTTNYPRDGSSELRIATPMPAELTVYIRIPGWLVNSPKLAVNEKPFDGPAVRGSFAAIRRKWRNNDSIQITLPLNVRTEPIDDRNPNLVAILRGPIMLVGINSALGGKMEFKPFYQVRDEAYTTYFQNSPDLEKVTS